MIPPATAIRSSIWKCNVCRLLLSGWGKQAGVEGWDGIFRFILHFKEGDQNKTKRSTCFPLPWPQSLVFIFPYIIFLPAWRPRGRGCFEEHCLTLLAAAHQLSSEPLRVALLQDKLQSSGESTGKQHDWKGGTDMGGKSSLEIKLLITVSRGCVCVPPMVIWGHVPTDTDEYIRVKCPDQSAWRGRQEDWRQEEVKDL